MDKQQEAIKDLRNAINEKINEAVAKANEGDLEGAKAIQAEVEGMKADLAQKEAELEELRAIAETPALEVEDEQPEAEEIAEEAEPEAEVEVEDPEEETKNHEDDVTETRSLEGADAKMVNLNELNKTNEQTELRSAINAYVKTKGVEKRDITTVEAGAVIPQEIITTPQEQPQTETDLRKFVNVEPVNTGSGTYPVLLADNSVMVSVEELKANPKLANPEFKDVDYKVETYRGYIPVSQEAIDDSAVDLTGLIAKHINRQAVRTANVQVANVLKTFTAKSITGLDGLKAIKNVDLDPAYNVKFIVSQSFFNAVDTMKDENGRYLLQQDVTVASGYKLFGHEVVILADKVIGTSAGDKVAFVGDADAGVTFFDRKQVSVKWVDNDIYGQKLASFIRFDVKQADEKAGFYVTLADEPVAGA